MEIKKVIGVVLIVASLALGYMGVNKISESTASVEVFNVKLGVSDNSIKEQGYMYLGLGLVLLGSGIYLLKGK